MKKVFQKVWHWFESDMATNDKMFSPRDGCIAPAIFLSISHKLNDFGNVGREHGQTAEDKEDHKEAAKGRLGENKIEIKSIFKIERQKNTLAINA